jgi:hypothetical protein
MDEVTLIRDVRPVSYDVIWDGTARTSRQLFAPEYPTRPAPPVPEHPRTVTLARREWHQRVHALTHATPQTLAFEEA